MKASTKEQAQGAFHQVKGTVKEVAGILSDDPKLEGEGCGERVAGKMIKKVGQIKSVLGK